MTGGNTRTVLASTRKRRGKLRIEVELDEGDWTSLGDAETMVTEVATALGRHLELPKARNRACVALTSAAEVQTLNKAWRGQDKPTNVLSFPSASSGLMTHGTELNLGDVILAHETVAREAAELGIPLDHHVRHLVLHGLLHLLGYDHATDEQAQVMEALEARILAGLGIADPYTEPALRKDTRGQ